MSPLSLLLSRYPKIMFSLWDFNMKFNFFFHLVVVRPLLRGSWTTPLLVHWPAPPLASPLPSILHESEFQWQPGSVPPWRVGVTAEACFAPSYEFCKALSLNINHDIMVWSYTFKLWQSCEMMFYCHYEVPPHLMLHWVQPFKQVIHSQ